LPFQWVRSRTKNSRQCLQSGPLVWFALTRDALQGRDGTEAGLEPVAAKLLDGSGEVLGDASLSVGLGLLLMAQPRGSRLPRAAQVTMRPATTVKNGVICSRFARSAPLIQDQNLVLRSDRGTFVAFITSPRCWPARTAPSPEGLPLHSENRKMKLRFRGAKLNGGQNMFFWTITPAEIST
jgi:hypothetical protein